MPIEFTRPEILGLLAALPVWAILVWPRAGRGAPFTRGGVSRRSWSAATRTMLVLSAPFVLRAGVVACVIVAMAGPVREEITRESATQGKGIALVVDLSSSMLATDMEEGRSRIEVAKEAAVRFATGRADDELTLVAFGGEVVTRVPPTTDAGLIVHGVESLEVQMVRDGTDISGAVLAAIGRLMESDREPRVVILMTDGAHNGVAVPPLAAARAAAAFDVTVHTISVLPEQDPLRPNPRVGSSTTVETMETVLTGLAGITGGQYFRASTGTALDSIYREINRIEVSENTVVLTEARLPLGGWIVLLASLLLALELLLRGSRWSVVH